MPIVAASVSLLVPSSLLGVFNSGTVWSAALLVALGYSLRSARVSGLNVRAMYWAVCCSLLTGLWGAHLLSMMVHGWDGGPWAAMQFVQGEKSLFGGLIAGGFAAALYFHWRKLPILAYADAGMPALALGYSIGRIGCFLNGDDYGTLTHVRWAVAYPPGTEAYEAHLSQGWISVQDAWSLPVHPVQLYASLLGLALFFTLAYWRPRLTGGRFCAYLVIYGTGRFLLEYLRGDFHKVLGPFSLPQLFSIGFVLFGVGLWRRMALRVAANRERGMMAVGMMASSS
jgi:phosphatidylglycerol---prolipoprotein diacylglyceryl transferase